MSNCNLSTEANFRFAYTCDEREKRYRIIDHLTCQVFVLLKFTKNNFKTAEKQFYIHQDSS